MSSFPRLQEVLLSHRYSLHTFPKGNLTSPLHELRFFTSNPSGLSSISEHLFRARCPKRDRFKLNRPLLNLSNPIYPTPLFSTTPVTLQQPPGSDLSSFIFFHFLSLPFFSPARHAVPVNIPACHWHVWSFGTGLNPRPGDLPSPRDVTTRRAPVS
jgi:hypothetical protein